MTLDNFKSSKSMTSASAFITGAQFQILDYGYDTSLGDDKAYAVFKTTIGEVSITALYRPVAVKPYIDANGKSITVRIPTGTLADKIRELAQDNRGKTNDEFLPILVNALKPFKYIVREREYVTRSDKYGEGPKALMHVDIVKEQGLTPLLSSLLNFYLL